MYVVNVDQGTAAIPNWWTVRIFEVMHATPNKLAVMIWRRMIAAPFRNIASVVPQHSVTVQTARPSKRARGGATLGPTHQRINLLEKRKMVAETKQAPLKTSVRERAIVFLTHLRSPREI